MTDWDGATYDTLDRICYNNPRMIWSCPRCWGKHDLVDCERPCSNCGEQFLSHTPEEQERGCKRTDDKPAQYWDVALDRDQSQRG